MGFDEAIVRRFWSKVDKRGPDECWEWQASYTAGYGKFMPYCRKNWRANRFAYQITHVEEDIKGKSICHTCDNKRCVNPKHLYAGDARTNILDCIERKRWKQVPAQFGNDNHNTKLTEPQVAYIKLLLAHGYGEVRIGRWYNVSGPTINQIRNNRSWVRIKAAELKSVGTPKNPYSWPRRAGSAS